MAADFIICTFSPPFSFHPNTVCYDLEESCSGRGLPEYIMPFLQVCGKQIHFTDHSPTRPGNNVTLDDVQTIICHHGLGSSQNFYGPIVPSLAAAGYRVITFDSSGAARSPFTPSEQSQSIASLASDVIEILDALSITTAIVIGHSMGGIVAAHLAQDGVSKDRVQAVVLIGPVYPSVAVSQAFGKRIELVKKDGMDPLSDTIPNSATGNTASPLVRAFIRELLLGQTALGYLSHCRVISDSKRPSYETMTAPTLMIAGDEDKSADLGICKKMFGEIGSKEKTLNVLHGIGHWHCLEAPEAVTKSILQFVQALPRRSLGDKQ